jgi:hypothetical protein
VSDESKHLIEQAEIEGMMQRFIWDWQEHANNVHTASPDVRTVYMCARAGPRSRRYFARHNGTYLATKKTRIFYGSLEKCKALCVEHFKNKYGVPK